MAMHLFLLPLAAVSVFALSSPGTPLDSPWCKPTYNSPGWPSTHVWHRLNESVSGRLVNPMPPGAVCHNSFAEYDSVTCNLVASQWSNTTFHALNLVSADYNDVACLPNSSYPCSVEKYPRFVVAALNAQDVQHAVSFARETGVRLIVKGTGHDVPGRSSGSEALSIQTHNMRGLSLKRNDTRAVALGGIASIKIQAGERMVDIYDFAARNNVTVVGGADPHVGIGGWVSHGGHGPLTAHYGMGADQVLEMEVVTADGVLRVVSEESEPDLFWAMRGASTPNNQRSVGTDISQGGASNFAVITSVTMKAYGILPYTEFQYSYNTTAKSDTFWSMVAYFHSEIPRLVESGFMGYFYVTPLQAASQDSSVQGRLYGEWIAPELTLDQVQTLLAPIEDHMKASGWEDPVSIIGQGKEHDDFMKKYAKDSSPEAAGLPIRIGSRLLDKKALSKPLPVLEKVLRGASDDLVNWPILGHVIAGLGTKSPKGGIAGGSNAVLPAWRKACMQIALPRSWDPLNQTQKASVTTSLRNESVQGLRDLAPDMGAYVSEADPTEPDWQRTFYGENYARLLALKRHWDPHGVFWYKNGVGSELWEPKRAFGIENGVGQNPVQLCRV